MEGDLQQQVAAVQGLRDATDTDIGVGVEVASVRAEVDSARCELAARDATIVQLEAALDAARAAQAAAEERQANAEQANVELVEQAAAANSRLSRRRSPSPSRINSPSRGRRATSPGPAGVTPEGDAEPLPSKGLQVWSVEEIAEVTIVPILR